MPYRFYVTTVAADDFVSAVYGNDIDTQRQLIPVVPTSVWIAPGRQRSSVFETFQVAYDSWVTIGVDGPTVAGENLVNAVGAPGAEGWEAEFESGEAIVMDDAVGGSWFILNEERMALPNLRCVSWLLRRDGWDLEWPIECVSKAETTITPRCTRSRLRHGVTMPRIPKCLRLHGWEAYNDASNEYEDGSCKPLR